MFQKYKTNDKVEISRRYMILEGITGIGQFSLTTGTFLAGFLNYLGTSKQLNGLIAVIPAITGIFQIVSPLIFERFASRKRPVIILAIFLRLMMALTFFLPLLFLKLGIALPVFIVIFIIAFSLNALLIPVVSSWMVDLTPLEIRGRFLATREKASLFITAIFTIVLARLLDITKMNNQAALGFVFIGIILLILGVINVISLMKSTEVEGKNISFNYRLRDVIQVPLKDKNFRKIIVLFIIWSFALQVGGPFISVYMVTNLDLSYTYMTTCTVISIVARVIFTTYWGRLADQKSWFLSTKLSLFILAFNHFAWGFVTPSNHSILIPILHIIGGLAWGGVGISLFNIQFLFAKQKGRTLYISLNAAISGIFSLIAATVGGTIIKSFEGVTFKIFGLGFSNFQLVFMISGIFIMLCPIYVHFIIERNVKDLNMN